MPEEMCDVLEEFVTPRCKDEEEKLQRKIWVYLETLLMCYFSVSTIVCTLKGARANVSDNFLANTTLLEPLGYFVSLNTLC